MPTIIFIIILLVLIVVHEFGHFIVAKKFGIRVDEFGIGFPPKMLTWMKKGETEYTLNWLPIGGFVRIFGENPDAESINGPDSARSFVNKPKLVQAAVLVAGVFFNMLLAWLLFWFVFVIGTPTAVDESELHTVSEPRLIIFDVLEGSPAEQVGLLPGDEILDIGEFTYDQSKYLYNPLPSEVIPFISERDGIELILSIQRGDEELGILVVPETSLIESNPEQAAIGISMDMVGLLRHHPLEAIWDSLIHTVNMTVFIAVAFGGFLWDAITLEANLADVAGPVGIVGVVGDATALGLAFLLNITALISINLAIINLLPFPALDGGRLLFVIIEAMKGSPIKPKIANTLNVIGFAFLIGLMVLVTYSDILKILN